MRALICLSVLALISCQSSIQREPPPKELLAYYARQSERTDPGAYESLYRDLPGSLDSLNQIIKCLLLHPMEARQLNLLKEADSYDRISNSSEQLLAELVEGGLGDLTCHAEAGDRLVVACYHHAMLLTSMLRNQGIPARMRAGFSRLYEKQTGIRFSHIICEVWDGDNGKWILVDPDRNLVDLSPKDFEFACHAWENVRKNNTDPAIYTASIGEGIKGIVNLMILDASLIVKDEKLYWDLPEIVMQECSQFIDLNDEILTSLNALAYYCSSPDERFQEISNLYFDTEAFAPSGLEYEAYFRMIMDRRRQQ